MKGICSLVILATMVVATNGYAGDHHSHGIHHDYELIPKNDLYIPVTELVNRGISEREFHEVLNAIEDIYGPEFRRRGMDLTIERRWADGRVNASARWFSHTTRSIIMYGGFARYAGVTKDILTLVACHEVGHHIGGAPLYNNKPLSAESQADYFATKTCAKKVWRQTGAMNGFDSKFVNIHMLNDCKKAYSRYKDINICARGVHAAEGLASVLAELSGEAKPRYSTPDTSEVLYTELSYPSAQCRMDTLSAGAKCDVSLSESTSQSSVTRAACTRRGKGNYEGVRPLCWYKPNYHSFLASN